MYHTFIIHSSVDGYLGYSQFLTIRNRAEINMVEQVSFKWDVEFTMYFQSGVAF